MARRSLLEDLLTAKDAAQALACSIDDLQQHVESNQILAFDVGDSTLYVVDRVLDHLAGARLARGDAVFSPEWFTPPMRDDEDRRHDDLTGRACVSNDGATPDGRVLRRGREPLGQAERIALARASVIDRVPRDVPCLGLLAIRAVLANA